MKSIKGADNKHEQAVRFKPKKLSKPQIKKMAKRSSYLSQNHPQSIVLNFSLKRV